MRNAAAIIKGDLRKLRHNIVAWAVILGLIIVPSLYTWFNLSAAWDPYGRTGELEIALASSDQGYEGDLLPISVNMGDKLLADIRSDDSFKWVITDTEDAIEGTKSGDYYAAIVVSEDFSEDMMSIFSENARHSELTYCVNQKKNAVASMLTTQGASGIQQKIDEVFTEEVARIAIETAKEVSNEGNRELASAVAEKLAQTVRHTQNAVGASESSVEALSSSISTMESLLVSAADFAENTEDITDSGRALSKRADKKINGVLSSIDERAAFLNKTLRDLKKAGVPGLEDMISRVKELQGDLKGIEKNLKTIKKSSGDSLDDIDEIAEETGRLASQAQSGLGNLKTALDKTSPLLAAAHSDLDKMASDLEKAAETGDSKAVEKVLSNNTEKLSEFIAAPVEISRNAIYPVENYGSALTPFYESLAIWVGALVLVALMSVTLEESRRRELDNIREYQIYLGRYFLFGAVSLLQTVLVCVGNLFYMGIQCVHPGLFILAGIVTSIVFSCLIYTLVSAFGNIGKAIAVIVLVMQVAGTGGVFPIEMTPDFFRNLYPIMPFKYSMTAMREAIGGTYDSVYWIALAQLLIYLAAALFTGLVLRKSLVKINEGFTRRIEETKVM